VLREEHDSNYGAVFSFWDRLFGTLKMQEPTAIGLHDVDDKYLENLLKNSFTMGVVKHFRGLLATFKSV
jgi:sterol desaturase/sphingolipid hydroxylase (fatty acid hydroxylase superfamily)